MVMASLKEVKMLG